MKFDVSISDDLSYFWLKKRKFKTDSVWFTVMLRHELLNTMKIAAV